MPRITRLLPPLLLSIPVVASAKPINLQLAMVYQNQPVSQYLVSEKYDGVRCYWDGQQLWTRHGNPIVVPARFTQGFPKQPLDGELWLGRQRFSQMAALIERADPTDPLWQQVHLMVFDLPAEQAPFSLRYQRLQQLLKNSPASLKLVEQRRIESAAMLQAWLKQIVASGGEGLMLHQRSSPYVNGRSHHLLKLKPYQDAEATVIGYLPGHGKYQGKVGALQVKDSHGNTFAIGSGLSDKQRAAPPAIGSVITFRYNGLTRHGKPRFARFLRIYRPL